MRSHAPFTPDCWCNEPGAGHEDDSYGACVKCREYVSHTEEDYRHVAFPCPTVRLRWEEVDSYRLAEALRALVYGPDGGGGPSDRGAAEWHAAQDALALHDVGEL
jgi:hypothetical protein